LGRLQHQKCVECMSLLVGGLGCDGLADAGPRCGSAAGEASVKGRPSGPAEGSPKGDLDGREADGIMSTSPGAILLRKLGGAENNVLLSRPGGGRADGAIEGRCRRGNRRAARGRGFVATRAPDSASPICKSTSQVGPAGPKTHRVRDAPPALRFHARLIRNR
jgi:hypothetical protein